MKKPILSNSDIQSINLWISKMNDYHEMNKKQMAKNAKSILQLKYKMIGSGKHRIVYDLQNGYVLKVAIKESGVKSNETEFKIYKNCPPELRKHLCLVIEFGQAWIIMEKMVSKIPRNKKYSKMLSELKNKFQMYGINPNDMHRNNWTLSMTGEIIVIDYGNFEFREN